MLKKFILKNPFQLFITILMPFLLITLLVIFTQSSFQYNYFKSFALNKVYVQQRTYLQNINRNITNMEQTVKAISVTAFFDTLITDLLYYDVSPEDYNKYISKLQSYKAIYPFLQSVYVYNGENMYSVPSSHFVYDRNTFNDKEIFLILDDMQKYRSHSMVLRKIPNYLSETIPNADNYTYVYSYLFFDSQLQSGKVSEAIVLNISEEWIRQNIGMSDPCNDNCIFIVDHYGRLLSENNKNPLLSDLSSNEYIKIVNSSKESNGSIRIKIGGVDSFVTYASTGVFNWKLISITPYDKIVQDIEKVKNKTYYLVSFFILGSIILSFYFSRRLYIPVKMVIQSYNKLESEKRNEFYYKKQVTLKRMVSSNEFCCEETYKKEFKKYDICFEPFDKFLLILMKIDNFSSFCNQYSFMDRSLLKYGIMNITSELFSKNYLFECIDIEEDQILILLKYDAIEIPYENEKLLSLVKEIHLNTKQYLKISLSTTISDSFETLNELNSHYLKTLDLSYYRLIYGHNSIIYNEKLNLIYDDYIYPVDLDKVMFEAVINGQNAESKKALLDLIHHASRYSFTIINSSLIRILLSIGHAVEVIENNYLIKLNFNLNIYLSRLQRIETLEQIESDLIQLFDYLSNELKTKKENKYITLLEDVIKIIDKEYARPDLSIEIISRKVNLSPAYLGRLFNKYRLISITDYINDVRLIKAHEWLIDSGESVNTIMEKSGFTSRSHFFTLFKRKYGMTPNQVRSKEKYSRE